MKPWRAAVGLFAGALALYLANLSLVPLATDSIPNAYLPSSLLGDADLAFSPFEAPGMFLWKLHGTSGEAAGADVQFWSQTPPGESGTFADLYAERRLEFDGWKYYVVPTVRSRASTGEPLFVGVFGPFPGLLALPVVALAQMFGARLWDQVPMVASAKLTAAALVAGSVVLIYLIALAYLPARHAALLATAYGAGTCVWAISSQALWQQTAELFFLALGAFFLVRVPTPAWRGALAGLAFSMAAACRPTAAFVALLVGAWLAFSDRRALAAFALSALPLAAAVAAFNQYYFGSPFDFGQLAAGARIAQYKTGSPELWQTPVWVGAAGLLASPSRGLFVYSPFLAMGIAGAVLAWREERYRPLRVLTLAVPALWLPAFAWFDWWGGWTFGYRPIVDSVPLLAVLCIPVLARVLGHPLWRGALAVALAWSVFVQALGAFAYSPWGWDARLVDAARGERASIDLPAYRHRLWSFSDWQIGYLITHFAEARAERARPAIY